MLQPSRSRSCRSCFGRLAASCRSCYYLVAHALDGALKDRPCIAAFDLGQPEGRRLLECLTRQTRLRLFFLNPNLEPLEEQILDWDLGQRSRARDLLAEALRDLDSIPTQDYDFSLAVSEIRSRY